MSTLQQSHPNHSAPDPTATAAERPAKEARAAEPEKAEKKADKGDPTPLFWRMFGASTMAIACSLAIVLYIQVTTSISGMRADVTVLREGYIQLVPKSEFSKAHSQVSTEIQTLQARNVTALEIWTSRVSEQERKIERMRGEHKDQVDALQREIQQLRERLAVLESRPATVRPKN